MANYEDRRTESEAEIREERAKREADTPRPERKPKFGSKKVAGCSKLNVRLDPDPDAEVLKTVDKDDILKINQKFNHPTFEQVVFPDGDVGYVNKNYLAPL